MLSGLLYEMGIYPAFWVTTLIYAALIVPLILIKVPYTGSSIQEWQHVVKDFKTSTDDFYSSITNKVMALNIPDFRGVTIVLKREGSLISPQRKYLRVAVKHFRIYISAGHFGTSNFFSSRIVPKISLLRWIVLKIPVLNQIFGTMYMEKTFYRSDARYSALTLIHDAVTTEVERLTDGVGVTIPQSIAVKPEMRAPLKRDLEPLND